MKQHRFTLFNSRVRRRRGVGTVVGTLFFVLIALMLFGVILSLFNSFSNYANTYKAYTQQNLVNQSTSLSISNAAFQIPVSVSTPSTIGTSTTKQANAYSPEDKLIYAQGLWWSFHSSGSAIVYATSSDGATWSAPITVTSSRSSNVGYTFSDTVSGNTFYYVLANLNNLQSFDWRYGTLNAGGTITWSIPETTVPTQNNAFDYDSIAIDSSGNPWVALTTYDGTNYYIEVYKYTSSSWNLANTIPGVTSKTTPMLLPVTSGIVLLYGTSGTTTSTITLITTATGSSWTSAISPPSRYASFQSSATSIGNTVYFAGMGASSNGKNTGTVMVWNSTYGGSSTSPETTVDAATGSWYVSISQLNPSDFFVFYGSGADMYYSYSTDAGALWSARQTISTSENALSGIAASDVGAGIAWTSGASSPFSVRFAFVTVSPNTLSVSLQANNPFAVHFISLYIYDVNSSTLVAHYDQNSSASGVAGVFDYWVSEGNTIQPSFTVNWSHNHSYLFTATTDQGLLVSANYKSPP